LKQFSDTKAVFLSKTFLGQQRLSKTICVSNEKNLTVDRKCLDKGTRSRDNLRFLAGSYKRSVSWQI